MNETSAWKKLGTLYGGLKGLNTEPLPSGVYGSFYSSSEGIYYHQKIDIPTDEVLDLPGLPIDYILKQVDVFWSKTSEYKKFGFLQKRGILLYGPPGCGKSSIIALLRRQIIKRNGVIFVPTEDFGLFNKSLADFRSMEPDRPIMTIVEDLETYLESSNGSNLASNEKAALSLYDGERQVNNVIHIATTNKPDAIADRFIRRPGRFDVVIGVHAPGRETRGAYLRHICKNIEEKQINEILDQTDGLSLAYMREIATTYLVLEIPLKETIARLKKQANQKYATKQTGFTIGFTEKED